MQKTDKADDVAKASPSTVVVKSKIIDTLTRKVGPNKDVSTGIERNQIPNTSNADPLLTNSKRSVPQQQLSTILMSSLNSNKPASAATATNASSELNNAPKKPDIPQPSTTDPGENHPVQSPTETKTETSGKSERESIMTEFLESEEAYLKKLKMIFDYWQTPMEDSLKDKKPLGTREQISELFSSLRPVYLLHTNEILSLLKKGHSSNFAKKFLEVIDMFKLYVHFVNHYENYIQIYTELLQKKRYRQFEREASTKAGVSNLVDILITPIQRLPRYQLFLERLVKSTPTDHPDHETLKEALEKMLKQNSSINQRKNDYESRLKLLLVQNTIGKTLNIVTPNRKLIADGFLNHNHATKGWVRVHFYLMNNLILITEVVADKKEQHELCLRKWTALSELIVTDINDVEFTINQQGGIPAGFSCQTDQEKHDWLKKLKDVVTAAPQFEESNTNAAPAIEDSDEDQPNSNTETDDRLSNSNISSISSAASTTSIPPSNLPPIHPPPSKPPPNPRPTIAAPSETNTTLPNDTNNNNRSGRYSLAASPVSTVQFAADTASQGASTGLLGPPKFRSTSTSLPPPAASGRPRMGLASTPSSNNLNTSINSNSNDTKPAGLTKQSPSPPPSVAGSRHSLPPTSSLLSPNNINSSAPKSSTDNNSTSSPPPLPKAPAPPSWLQNAELNNTNSTLSATSTTALSTTTPTTSTKSSPTTSRTAFLKGNIRASGPATTGSLNSTSAATTTASTTTNATSGGSGGVSSISSTNSNPSIPLSSPGGSNGAGRPLPVPPHRMDPVDEQKLRDKVRELEDKVALLTDKLTQFGYNYAKPGPDGKYLIKALITFGDTNFKEVFYAATPEEITTFVKKKFNVSINNNTNTNATTATITNASTNTTTNNTNTYILEYFDNEEFKTFVVLQKIQEMPNTLQLRLRKL